MAFQEMPSKAWFVKMKASFKVNSPGFSGLFGVENFEVG